jgi:hypothetical protein
VLHCCCRAGRSAVSWTARSNAGNSGGWPHVMPADRPIFSAVSAKAKTEEARAVRRGQAWRARGGANWP